jgi:hypothetical protein
MDTFGRIARYRSAARSHPNHQLMTSDHAVHKAHLEHLSNLQSDLVTFSQSTLSDKLHNLGQILLLLQNLLGSRS